MLALAWFRLAPWIVKPAIYDDGHWQLAFVGRPDRVPAERDPQIPGQALTDLAVYDALLRRADADMPEMREAQAFLSSRAEQPEG